MSMFVFLINKYLYRDIIDNIIFLSYIQLLFVIIAKGAFHVNIVLEAVASVLIWVMLIVKTTIEALNNYICIFFPFANILLQDMLFIA